MALPLREHLLLWWGSLHIGEMIRRRALRRALRPLRYDGVQVLDVGCGRGDLALWIARRCPDASVHVIDIDPKLVELVERRINARGLRNIDVTVGDVERFVSTPSPTSPQLRQGFAGPTRLRGTGHSPSQREGEKRAYDTIYSVDVFEHLKDPAQALRQLAAVLAPRGTLLVHVPRATQRRFFRRFEHYEQHDHERDGFEPEDLKELVRSAGLEVSDIRHTFGLPGALAWELFHLANGVGKWFALLTYSIPWTLAWLDSLFQWKRGNGVLIVARKP